MNRPNFLLVTTDQQRADTLGRVNSAIRTPNLDRLAARGILFDRAYTVNPVCTPARCSILTGQYPSRHGCHHVGTWLPENYGPTLGARLADAGYFPALAGKAHFQPCFQCPGSFEAAPRIFDADFFRAWGGPYYGFERARLVIGHSSEAHACGMHYGAWLRERGVDPARYFGVHEYTHHGVWDLPEDLHAARWVADEAIASIEEARRRDDPFFVWASFPDPHNPYVCPQPWASMYRPDDLPDPAETRGDFGDKPPFYRALREGRFYGDDPDLQANNEGDCRIRPGFSAADRRRLWAAYYGMVSLTDHHVGRVLDHLAANGMERETVVVFTSDHGDMLGAHGLWGKGLPAYEEVQRLPFIVAHPGCRTPGARSDSLQSLVDLMPTFCALAGADPGAAAQGVSQAEPWVDARVAARRFAMAEFRPSAGSFFQWTFVFGRWKLVLYRDRDYGELYDLDADPEQRDNLFAKPGHATLLAELKAAAAPHMVTREAERARPRLSPA